MLPFVVLFGTTADSLVLEEPVKTGRCLINTSCIHFTFSYFLCFDCRTALHKCTTGAMVCLKSCHTL